MSYEVLPLPASGGETILAAVAPVFAQAAVSISLLLLCLCSGVKEPKLLQSPTFFQNALLGSYRPLDISHTVLESQQRQNGH